METRTVVEFEKCGPCDFRYFTKSGVMSCDTELITEMSPSEESDCPYYQPRDTTVPRAPKTGRKL